MNGLPDEVLLMIFSHFDAIFLTDFEEVCEKWKKILQHNPSLWRNAPYDSRDVNTIKETLCEIDHIRSRSGGKLYDISLYIDASQDLEDIKPFFNLLPETGVRHLKIEVYNDPWIVRHYPGSVAGMTKTFQECIAKTLEAMVLFPDLKTLHIKGTGSQTHKIVPLPFKELPITKCRLREFRIMNLDVSRLFRPDSVIFQILPDAQIIELHRCNGLNQDTLIKLIQMTKETLTEFCCERSILRQDEEPRNSSTIQKLSLPRLTHLKWNTVPLSDGNKLICPALRYLCIENTTFHSLFDGSQYNSVETITFSDYYGIEPIEETVDEIQKYTKACRLVMGLSDKEAFTFIRQRIERTSVEEWCFLSDEMENFVGDIIEMVKTCHQNLLEKDIKMLHLYHNGDHGISARTLRWLDRNVKHFKYVNWNTLNWGHLSSWHLKLITNNIWRGSL